MNRLRGALVALAVTAAMLGACTLTTDLDGLSGGPLDGGPDGTTPSDGTTPGVDGTSPLTEAGADAGPGEAGAACPNTPVALCEEFASDEKANGWVVTQEATATASVLVNPDGGERGAVYVIPAAASGAAPVAYWTKSFDKTISKFNFDVDMAYDNRPTNPGEYHILFQLVISQGSTYQLMYLTVPDIGNGFALQDFPDHPDNLDYRVIDVTPAVRHHIHVDVEVGGRSRFSVDGVTLQDNTTPAFMKPGVPTLNIGVVLSGVPTTPITTGYAHLVFTGE